TRIGLLFMSSVTEANADQVPAQTTGQGNNNYPTGQASGSAFMNDPRMAIPIQAQGATVVQPTTNNVSSNNNNMTGSNGTFLQQGNGLR
ncbi:MAG TPA: hypothetical protein VGF14_05255, partial [Alphaproteobacteria bacterium]